jgi:hypothetical protein
MAAPTRVTLTKAEAASPFGQRLIHQILAMSHDGELVVDEVTALHATLLDGPRGFNAVLFLRRITTGILADGCLDDVEAYQLRRAMERVVPKSVRLKLTEVLSDIGLPGSLDEDGLPAARGSWRRDPATARQLLYIENLGGQCMDGMTKGQAASLIDDLLERRPPSPRQHMLLRFFDRVDLSRKTKEEVSAWIDRLYIEHEEYERAWDLFKIDIGDDGSIRDPLVVPIGAYRKYLRTRPVVVPAHSEQSVPSRFKRKFLVVLIMLALAALMLVAILK